MKVILYFVLVIAIVYGQTDPTRDILMGAQIGDSADIGLGQVFNVFFVRLISWLPRWSFFSFSTISPKLNLWSPLRLNVRSVDLDRAVGTLNKLVLDSPAESSFDFYAPSLNLSSSATSTEMMNLVVGSFWISLGATDVNSFLNNLAADPMSALGLPTKFLDWLSTTGNFYASQVLLNDDITDYIMGIFNTGIWALLAVIISVIWGLSVCCTCVYCTCFFFIFYVFAFYG